MEDRLLALAITGWAMAIVMMGLWFGERRMRIFIQNYTTFGGNPTKAKLYVPDDAEDAIEDAIDRIQGIAGTKRTAPPQDGKFTEDTLQNGIAFLLHEARESGTALSVEQATEEALRMLNAEGSEM